VKEKEKKKVMVSLLFYVCCFLLVSTLAINATLVNEQKCRFQGTYFETIDLSQLSATYNLPNDNWDFATGSTSGFTLSYCLASFYSSENILLTVNAQYPKRISYETNENKLPSVTETSNSRVLHWRGVQTDSNYGSCIGSNGWRYINMNIKCKTGRYATEDQKRSMDLTITNVQENQNDCSINFEMESYRVCESSATGSGSTSLSDRPWVFSVMALGGVVFLVVISLTCAVIARKRRLRRMREIGSPLEMHSIDENERNNNNNPVNSDDNNVPHFYENVGVSPSAYVMTSPPLQMSMTPVQMTSMPSYSSPYMTVSPVPPSFGYTSTNQ